MKHLTLYDVFNEAKNVGILYHFTSLVNLYKIVRSNELVSSRTFDDITKRKEDASKYYFSFTRNKYMPRTANKFDNPMNSKITLDGTAISQHHFLRPVNYWQPMQAKNQADYSGRLTSRYDESEEAVVQADSVLKNLSAYVLSIDLPTLADYQSEFEFYSTRNRDALFMDYNIYGKALDLNDDEITSRIDYLDFYDSDIQTIYEFLIASVRKSAMFRDLLPK